MMMKNFYFDILKCEYLIKCIFIWMTLFIVAQSWNHFCTKKTVADDLAKHVLTLCIRSRMYDCAPSYFPCPLLFHTSSSIFNLQI